LEVNLGLLGLPVEEIVYGVVLLGGLYGGVTAVVKLTSWIRSRKVTHGVVAALSEEIHVPEVQDGC
jgi:hypothetical protein